MTERGTPAEKAEAAAIRRRWITLGEIVGIAGLIISALALWNSYADRRTDEAEKHAEKISETKAETAVLLVATPQHDGETLVLRDASHPVQSITVTFPTAIGTAPQTSAPSPKIEARWFAAKLIAMTDGGADTKTGRLPVLITSDYWAGDRHITDSAVYDIAWRTEGRLLRGRALRLDGLLLREHGGSAARLNTLWSRMAPAPPK